VAHSEPETLVIGSPRTIQEPRRIIADILLLACCLSVPKYQQILASVREVGIIEPLIVFPQDRKSEMYILLDGHLRLAVLSPKEILTGRQTVLAAGPGIAFSS